MNPVAAASLVGLTTSTGALIHDPSGALIGLVVGTLLTSLASLVAAARRSQEKQQFIALLAQEAQRAKQSAQPQVGLGGGAS